MNNRNIFKVYKLLDINNAKYNNGWVTGSCPFSERRHSNNRDIHPSFGIAEGEISGFHCFSCQINGGLKSLPSMLSFNYHKDYSKLSQFIQKHENTELLVIPDYAFLNPIIIDTLPETLISNLSPIAASWRNISRATLDMYGIRQNETSIAFPMRDNFNRLVGIKYRKDRNFATLGKYKRAGIFFGSQFFNPDKPLFLVEGERDVMLMKQFGVTNVWGISGNISPEQFGNLRKVNVPIVIFMDNDKAGEIYKGELIDALTDYSKLYIVNDYCNCKDAAELYENKLLSKSLKSIKSLKNEVNFIFSLTK